MGSRLAAPRWGALGAPQRCHWALQAGSFLREWHVPLPNGLSVIAAFSAISGASGAHEHLQDGHAGGRILKQPLSPLVVSCSATISPDGAGGLQVSGECG